MRGDTDMTTWRQLMTDEDDDDNDGDGVTKIYDDVRLY